MLNIFFGDMPEAIYGTSLYFDNTYLDHWLKDPFARKIIKSVDKAKYYKLLQAYRQKRYEAYRLSFLSDCSYSITRY